MKTLLFASCDVIYFKRFGKSFVKSAIAHNNHVHVHIINPEIGLERIDHPLVTYSFEEGGPDSREYYASNRFFIAPEILLSNQQHDMKLLILDIDCVIREKIQLPDSAVALYFRKPFGSNDWERRGTRVAAGAVMYDNTAWLFAQRVADRIRELPHYWFVDQVALAETFDEFSMSINVHDFATDTIPVMDWEFSEESPIWTAKGDRKNNEIFLREQAKYL